MPANRDISDYMKKRLAWLAYLAGLAQTTPENAGRLVFVQHDTTPGRLGHGKKYSSLPETQKQLYDAKFSLVGKLGDYIRSILRVYNQGMTTKDFDREWGRLFDHDTAFSNKNDGTQMENLYCGGSTFKTTGRIKKSKGVVWTEVYAVDPFRPPAVTEPTLLFSPVINTITPVPGSTMTRKIPFGQFNGNAKLPLLAKGGRAWVKNCVFVDLIQSPFFP